MDCNTCFCLGQNVHVSRVIQLLIVVVFPRKWFFLTQSKVNLVLVTLCTIVYYTIPQIIFLTMLNILLAVNVTNVETFNITFINYIWN